MDERKKEIINLMLHLDLKVNEYKEFNKKYETNKENLSEEQLKKVEEKYKKILEEISSINARLKELNEE